jgi:hypothetical protein
LHPIDHEVDTLDDRGRPLISVDADAHGGVEATVGDHVVERCLRT